MSAYNEMRTIRFWSKVDRRGPDDCWNWLGSKHQGYGYFRSAPREMTLAHRFSYAQTNGDIPEGMVICHHCDNPSCVNPSHLFCGTQADNIADCKAKNRVSRKPPCMGSAHKLAKLTEQQAIEIYRATGTQGEIAKRFGVTQTKVSKIKRGVSWYHATGARNNAP